MHQECHPHPPAPGSFPPGRHTSSRQDPMVGVEDVPSHVSIGNVSSLSFAGSEQPQVEKRWNLQERGMLWPWTSYWTTLCLSFFICSVLLWGNWDHACKVLHMVAEHSMCSINVNFLLFYFQFLWGYFLMLIEYLKIVLMSHKSIVQGIVSVEFQLWELKVELEPLP